MVMDPTFLAGLPPGADGQRAKDFIAGACGVVCLEVTVGAGTITGQVTRQDGEPVAAERLIYARGLAAAAVTLGVTLGTAIATSAADGLAFKTDAAGAFALSVVATPPAVVILVPDGGESRLVEAL